jgi:CBS domain-containing protein
MEDLQVLFNTPVKTVMTENVITLLEYDSIATVFRIFDRSHISGAPVMNEKGMYIGIVTKTDLAKSKLLEYMAQSNHQLDKVPIRHLMNPVKLITVEEKASLMDAAKLMTEKRIHRVFVTDKNGFIVGIVSTSDITKLICQFGCDAGILQETPMTLPVESLAKGPMQFHWLKDMIAKPMVKK